MQDHKPKSGPLSFLKDKTTLGILALGILLRMALVVQNRSLWMDESMLGLNIITKTIPQLLTQPLDYNQGAPLLFLLIEKLFVLLLGPHDWVLRLFPLIAGIASLFIFASICNHLLASPGKHIALLTFAVVTDLIYFSNEAKQYHVDIAVALAIFLLLIKTLEQNPRELNRKAVLQFAVFGTMAAFLSHPAAFCLGGVGVVFLIQYFIKVSPQTRKKNFMKLALIAISWAGAYALLYTLSLQGLSNNDYLLDFWSTEFMPMPPWQNWAWFPQRLTNSTDPFGLVPPYQFSVIALLLIGSVVVIKKRPSAGTFLGVMVVFAMLASSIRFYPFGDRMVLFLFPFIILLCGFALQWIYELSVNRIRWVAIGLTTLLTFLTLYGSLFNTTMLLLNPYSTRIYNVKALVSELQPLVDADEPIYLYHAGIPSFLFYWEAPAADSPTLLYGIASREDESKYIDDLAQLYAYDSVWVVFSHVWPTTDTWIDERLYMLEILDAHGERMQEISTAEGTFAYRYQFSTAH